MSEEEIESILIAICIGSMAFNFVTVCLNHKAIWSDDGAREVLKFFEKINEHFVIGDQAMTKEECINTLAEMKENCANGTKYDDPKRWTKAEALRYAIDILRGPPVGSEWEESIQSLNEQMDKLGAHYASSTFCMPDSKKTVSITIWDKDWMDD